MEDYIKQLNPQQQKAVLYTDGPQLVIAGAGSGKTRVLTYKIVHLLAHGYEPWRILALTFTNKAAREMRQRIESIVGAPTAAKLWMGTFHSIFARILHINADRIGFKSDFTIYDAADSKSLIRTIIRDMDLDEKVYKPATVASMISMAKNALISPDRYALDRDIMEADRRAHRPLTHEIYRAYMHRCFVSGAMDFDDLLYFTNLLLRDNPDVLRHYQGYFRYVLIDEYQDTNFAQHLIATQLCAESQKLCVVGDDAQSIYSFRGANIRNILNLRQTYPSLQIFKLEQNYRSTQNIINAANSLIEKNKEQIPKHIFSENAPGRPIEITQSYSDYEEAILVASRVSQMHMMNHDSFNDYAILYRTNMQSRRLEEALRNRNIPYRIYGGLSFYQRKEIKDAVAYFRLAVNPDDDEALRRIINYPARGIGETTVGKLSRAALDAGKSIWHILNHLPDQPDLKINSGTAKKLEGFRALIESFVEKNVAEPIDAEAVASYIISATGLLSSLISDRTPESISKQENLQELLSGVHDFVSDRQEQGIEGTSLSDFLGQVSLDTDVEHEDSTTGEPPAECVTLMTVHASKGLEFSNVFIVGVEEELFPSAMSCDSPQQIEEERRLLYVAITRAKTNCHITYAASRYKNGQNKTCAPSRFLKDIDRRFMHLSAGSDLPRADSVINPIDNYRRSTTAFPSRQRQPEARSSISPRLRPISAAPAPQSRPAAAQSDDMHQASSLRPGMTIEHLKFGRGRIEAIDSQSPNPSITVAFDALGEKKLLLRFARFKIVQQ